jgi:hypothetical protein
MLDVDLFFLEKSRGSIKLHKMIERCPKKIYWTYGLPLLHIALPMRELQKLVASRFLNCFFYYCGLLIYEEESWRLLNLYFEDD